MSIVKGSFTTRIEDYSAINTGLALDVNEHRWYNNVDGYSSDQVILLIGNGVTTIANLLKYGNPTNTSEVITSSPATITAGADHTVFVDTNTIGGSASLLVNDPTVINYRLTVVAVGAYLVNVTLTGFSVEQVPSGEARSYVWNGISWVLASGGGGGGDLAGIQVPQPKTWVEKWTGNQASVTNTWGDGIYILTGIPTSDSIDRTAILVIENNADVKSALVDGLLSSTNHKAFEYDSVTGTFTSWLGGVETLPITRIQRFEDDPDNLPLVTIPADPATIPGWVEEYNNPTPQITPVEYVDNTWGGGLFYFGVSYIFLTEEVRSNGIMAVEVDGIDRTVTLNVSGSSSVIVKYYGATNEFRAFAIGTDFTSVSMVAIYKWDSVSTGDLPVPVDGWEQKFYDYTNTANVINAWGSGTYRFTFMISTGIHKYPGTFDVNLDELSAGDIVRSASYTASTGNSLRFIYDYDSNSFQVDESVTGDFYIVEIWKFNSLVNVLHSFVPDPRSVAQKDWVYKYGLENGDAGIASIVNSWGTGKYLFTVCDTALRTGSAHTVLLDLQALTDTLNTAHGGAVTAAFRVRYNPTGNTFSAEGDGNFILDVSRWEDSQASDAPRTVLDDGWELVFEDPTPSAATVLTSALSDFGIGEYRVEYFGPTNIGRTGYIKIDQLTYDTYGPMNSAFDVLYDVSAGTIGSSGSGYFISKVWKFTGLLRIDAQVVTNTSEGSNITNAVIDTDAGDVDASSYFTDTTQDRVVKLTNDGTNGNHLTGCPNGIEIGDGKTVEFYYNLGWRYQDVKIDEYVSGLNEIQKWAGGMRITWTSGASPVYDRWKTGI